MLCNKCPKRNSCVELCEAAEEFVDQDHIKLRETPISNTSIIDIDNIIIDSIEEIQPLNTKDWIYLIKTKPGFSPIQKHYLYLYYWEGISQPEIAKKYNTLQSNVCNIINRAKAKIKIDLLK